MNEAEYKELMGAVIEYGANAYACGLRYTPANDKAREEAFDKVLKLVLKKLSF